MSVSLYEYNPKYCDGEPCPGDCDLCNKWQEFPEEEDDGEDIQSETEQ